MATAAEAQALLDSSSCDRCYLVGMEWYGVLAALINIINGTTVPDAQTLATEASCLSCVISPGNLGFAILAALRDSGIGGGSGGGVLSGAGAPVADPGETAALYIDTNDGTLYLWYGSPGAWH